MDTAFWFNFGRRQQRFAEKIWDCSDFSTAILLMSLNGQLLSTGNNLDQNITIFVHKNSALPAKSLFAKSLRVSVEKQLSGKHSLLLCFITSYFHSNRKIFSLCAFSDN